MSTTIPCRNNEISLGPKEITPKNVQYFSHHTQEYMQSQSHKAKKFVEHNCIRYIGDGSFECLPISGYNTRTYLIKKGANGEFNCNCQRALKGGEGSCSHVLALYYFFKINNSKEKGAS